MEGAHFTLTSYVRYDLYITYNVMESQNIEISTPKTLRMYHGFVSHFEHDIYIGNQKSLHLIRIAGYKYNRVYVLSHAWLHQTFADVIELYDGPGIHFTKYDTSMNLAYYLEFWESSSFQILVIVRGMKFFSTFPQILFST